MLRRLPQVGRKVEGEYWEVDSFRGDHTACLEKIVENNTKKRWINNLPLRIGWRNVRTSSWVASWGPGLFSPSSKSMSSGGGGDGDGCTGKTWIWLFRGGCTAF